MKIVIAPDSFKEALSAKEAAAAIAEGVRAAQPDARIVQVPLADGGEGTMETIVEANGGSYEPVRVTGPLDEMVEARFGLIDDGKTAVVEMAQASGLMLIAPERRDPMKTTTKGTGELIKAALDRNVDKIIIAIGGSATVDGGCGMAAALGAVMTEYEGDATAHGGGELGEIAQFNVEEIDPRVKQTEIVVACDVTNPLLGQNGAARMYGPQKGATPEQVEVLEQNLEFLAGLLETTTGRELRDLPGAGAAGGLGMGLAGFLGAKLCSGFEIVADAVNLAEQMRGADLVITGEGSVDSQSAQGKVLDGVGRMAEDVGVRTVALAGRAGPGGEDLRALGIARVVGITPVDTPLAKALAECGPNLTRAAKELAEQETS